MVPYPPPHDSRHPSGMARVVARNIQALLTRRRDEDRSRRLPDRLADSITRFTGSMAFVAIHLIAIHLIAYGLWIAANLGWLSRLRIPRFDPSFVILAMEASVEAIFLSTFVLISQNRMNALADKRADLDLQVSLLAEHEVTRLISLVTAMAQKMGVEAADDPELAELAQDVAPERVLDEMEAGARTPPSGVQP